MLAIGLLLRLDLLQPGRLCEVWRARRGLLVTMVALQLGVAAVSVLRYRAVLRALQLHPRLDDTMAATLVSLGIAQWLPAPGGVAEVLRIGLMCGAEAPPDGARLLRLSLASLVEKMLGFGAVFLAGAAGAAIVWRARAVGLTGGGGSLAALAAVFAAAGLALVLLPGLLARLGRRLAGPPPDAAWQTWRGVAVWRRPMQALRQLAWHLRGLELRPRALILPLLLSLMLFLLLGAIFQLALRAVGGTGTLADMLVALPALTVASMLPVSVAGLGGPQLVAVGVFDLMGLDRAAVASASVLNAILVLIVHTTLAALMAGISFRQIARLIAAARRRHAADRV